MMLCYNIMSVVAMSHSSSSLISFGTLLTQSALARLALAAAIVLLLLALTYWATA
ncbi:hypothetical protein [Erwinia typographi]|uniref:hypothetical protein n=1 Tax=Erwinia typographi TaxID=371042 RepID=UPI000A5224CC|nr:hypothetical protein [Erwinia typographi]